MKPEVQFRLRIRSGADIAVGPGKIELLEAIASSGSITAAAKSLGMSYRRAWLLVDTMNRCFKSRVGETEAGGNRGGGTGPRADLRVHGAADNIRLAMEVAFIIDPLASLKAYKDTSVAMMRALQARGAAPFVLETADLFWTASAKPARG